MQMALIDLGPVMFGSQECVIQWLQQKRLISATKQCHRCPSGTMMILCENSNVADGYKWRCYCLLSVVSGGMFLETATNKYCSRWTK